MTRLLPKTPAWCIYSYQYIYRHSFMSSNKTLLSLPISLTQQLYLELVTRTARLPNRKALCVLYQAPFVVVVLQSEWVQGTNRQATMRNISRGPEISAVLTHGGLFVISVLRMTGTLVISVTY